MEFNLSIVIFFCFYLNVYIARTEVDLFTSSAQLKQVINIEQQFTKKLGSVTLKTYERHLIEFRQFYNRLEKRLVSSWRSNYDGGIFDTVRDPLATFINLHETTNVWLNTGNDNPLINRARKEFNDVLLENFANIPSKEDLEGSANAIFRLQSTYHLTSRDLYDQFTRKYNYPNSHVCDAILMLGKFAYDHEDYKKTKMWLDIAMELNRQEFGKSKHELIEQRIDILDHLAFAEHMLGNDSNALSHTKEILFYEPRHARAIGNLEIIQSIMHERDQNNIKLDKTVNQKTNDVVENEYQKLCRDTSHSYTPVANEAKCSLMRHNPIQYLKPIPYEVISTEPKIIIYYEVVTNDEITMLKQLAYRRLRRATVNNHDTGEIITADYRISKSGWLMDNKSAAILNINKRLEALTGLTSSTAESWQIANYGLGGHYEPHYDWSQNFTNSDLRQLGHGDRVATLLLYLSDVEAGGATVFLKPRVTVFPRKGSAVFWYNLHRNGKGDPRTKHAACPVLYGEKWVANKWFHEVGQEFRRPCSINPLE